MKTLGLILMIVGADMAYGQTYVRCAGCGKIHVIPSNTTPAETATDIRIRTPGPVHTVGPRFGSTGRRAINRQNPQIHYGDGSNTRVIVFPFARLNYVNDREYFEGGVAARDLSDISKQTTTTLSQDQRRRRFRR